MSDRIRIQRRKQRADSHWYPQLTTDIASLTSVTAQGLVNHEISRISLRPQGRLTVSQPGDFYEQEADQVAQQVMSVGDRANNNAEQREPDLQQEEIPKQETTTIQRQASSLASGSQTQETSGGPVDHSGTTTVVTQPITQPELHGEPLSLDDFRDFDGRINSYVAEVRKEVNAWRAYRTNSQGEMPGKGLNEPTSLFNKDWRSTHLTPQTGVIMAQTIPQSLKDTCSSKLGPDDLFMLQEMLSMNPLARGTIEDFFNVEPVKVLHKYKCRIRVGFRLGGELLVGLGVSFRNMTIWYENNLGWKWTAEVRLFQGNAGAGLSVPLDANVELGTEELGNGEATTPPMFYWAPKDFQTGLMGGNGPAVGYPSPEDTGFGHEYAFAQVITFYNAPRDPISFDMSGYSPATLGTGLAPSVSIVGATAGYATLGPVDSYSVPGAPPPEQQETGEFRTWLTAQIFFDTGKHEILPDGQTTLRDVFEQVQQFHTQYPEYYLRIVLQGHASPRWQHPQKGKIPHDLNFALAQMRANAVREQMSNIFRGATDPTCDVQISSCAGAPITVDDPTNDAIVESQGSLDALAEGRNKNDDWWHDRRVDIIILRNEMGVVTNRPSNGKLLPAPTSGNKP